MFPNAVNPPTVGAQKLGDDAIPEFVTANLWLPVVEPTLGHPAVAAAPVPETAVNKNSQTFPEEGEVRATRKRYMATPTGDAVGSEDRHQP